MVSLRARSYLPAVLGFFCCGCFLLPPAKCTPTNPLLAPGVLDTFRVSNSHQCRRLCWYQRLCVRQSFYSKTDSPDGDNCVLHRGDSAVGQDDVLGGWSVEKASGMYLHSDHGCKFRPCNDTEMCVPVRKHLINYVCIDLPTIDLNECDPNPCLNGGTCEDQFHGFTCHCPPAYTGDHCQEDNWLGMACTGTCTPSPFMADCFTGRCLCKDGYYFSISQYTCVLSCSHLNSTYLFYEDYDLLGHDETSLLDRNRSATECQSHCTADPQCRTVVYLPIKGHCFLKYGTAQDFPSAWKYSTGVHTFQRTCD